MVTDQSENYPHTQQAPNGFKIIIITIIAFAAYFLLDELYFKSTRRWLNDSIHQTGISHIIAYTLFGIPLFIGILLLHGKRKFFESLGLHRSAIKGLLFAIICTLPMFACFAIIFDFNRQVSVNTILISVIAAGFFEELYFRGFLFGQLYRYTRLGFLPAVFLGALLYALFHLYTGAEVTEIVLIFLITFLWSLLFGWIYAEWDYNLWVPVFLHMLINLSWELFNVTDTAFGGVNSIIYRIITIVLVIVLTVVYKSRRGLTMDISRRTIWMRRKNVYKR